MAVGSEAYSTRWHPQNRVLNSLVISTPTTMLRVDSGRNLRSLTFVRDDRRDVSNINTHSGTGKEMTEFDFIRLEMNGAACRVTSL